MTDELAKVRELLKLATSADSLNSKQRWIDQSLALLDKMDAGWRPIETAPRDGTHVLTTNTVKRFPSIASFSHGCWDILDAEDIEYRPTHWMPLPSPPTKHSAEG